MHQLREVHPSSLSESGIADMVRLGEAGEWALLHNMRLRYQHDAIYSNLGDILVSLNPYKPLNIYSDHDIALAKAAMRSGRARADLEPHVYTLSALMYSAMMRHGMPQSLVVSGESGAGKTKAVD